MPGRFSPRGPPTTLCSAHAQVVAGLNYKLVLSIKDKAKKRFDIEALLFQVLRGGTLH